MGGVPRLSMKTELADFKPRTQPVNLLQLLFITGKDLRMVELHLQQEHLQGASWPKFREAIYL